MAGKAFISTWARWLGLIFEESSAGAGNIAWKKSWDGNMRGYRYAMICADMQDMVGFCFDVRFFLVIPAHVQSPDVH